jgi:hypothetical protein
MLWQERMIEWLATRRYLSQPGVTGGRIAVARDNLERGISRGSSEAALLLSGGSWGFYPGLRESHLHLALAIRTCR